MPSLVITDVIMPEMEGMETIQALRRISSGVKIIAISGGGRRGPQDLLRHTRQFGADDTFAKPIDSQKFLASVARLLTDA